MDSAEAVWKEHLQRLGGYIRAQRQFAHLSQRQLADMADLSDTYMSQLERGLHEPSIRVLRALAENLGLSTDQLLRRAAGLDGADPSDGAISTEDAIRRDHRFTDAQKQALLGVVRSYVDANEA
jgi:transcriptional regulator with XRE-family HTH domain